MQRLGTKEALLLGSPAGVAGLFLCRPGVASRLEKGPFYFLRQIGRARYMVFLGMKGTVFTPVDGGFDIEWPPEPRPDVCGLVRIQDSPYLIAAVVLV